MCLIVPPHDEGKSKPTMAILIGFTANKPSCPERLESCNVRARADMYYVQRMQIHICIYPA